MTRVLMLLILCLVPSAALQQANDIEVKTYVSFDGAWRSESGGRVRWRLGQMLYLAADGYWLRLNGTISQYSSQGSKLFFNFREGHSEDLGKWSEANDGATIHSIGRRVSMSNPNIETETFKEEWFRHRQGKTKEAMVILKRGGKVRLKLLFGQIPDQRVLSAIDDERKKARSSTPPTK